MPKPIIIFGFHPIQAQLNANPECLIKVYTSERRHNKRLDNIVNQLNNLKINTQQCNKQQLDNLSKNQAHQGIVAEILPSSLPNQEALMHYIAKLKKAHLILLLDSIQDPRNLGACLRSADAAGVDCVVLNKDRSAPINALVHKTCAGALGRLKIFSVTNLSRTIKALQSKNIWVIGLDSSANYPFYQIDLTASSAIVIGGEGQGLRKLSKQSCDQLAVIPMYGNVESLNVSVATGIALFEANRQRHL